MGLVIQGTKVLVDHNVNEHLRTEKAGNPKRYRLENPVGEIDILSIFTRLKATARHRRDRVERKLGDNCPMIYAFKGKQGLTTGYRSVRAMLLAGQEIADDLAFEADAVLGPIPSSHNVARHLTSLLHERFNIPVMEKLLTKASVDSALKDLGNAVARSENWKERKGLNNEISKLREQPVLALKNVSTRYRSAIQAVVLGPVPAHFPAENVIFVDDLVASGTSLISAKNALRSRWPDKQLRAVTLFSNV